MIRQATMMDVDALRSLSIDTFTQTFGYLYAPEDLTAFIEQTYSHTALSALLQDPAYRFWLMYADETAETPIGYALAGPCSLPHDEVCDEDGEIKRLYIRNEYQGGGRGAALMERALDWLEDEGRQRIWLGVWSQNDGAQRFYRRYGFTHIGEYEFVVGNQHDHEFILRRG